ncbi:alpha/beta hydrolase [Saccharopolyspora gloriosae]|uniref:Pimeloyl-ACP methyl ester carboxylesterase n=1 Tax=Saccharopolyspora gloriosae TaxID=455344 RepID=A0A840NCD0_9PSEU|nr:pimeloyl-ACP methyl ester carboxylesterase [Saccharopolyspora gloriosae]
MTSTEVPHGPGSVASAPRLPAGFTDVFRDHYVTVDGLRSHYLAGGGGSPLLVLGGWPQNWYQWRFVLLELAERFSVVAVDPRGVNLTDKPATGYDSGTLAADLVGLMRALGHERFALVAHDIGVWTGYALAADHPGVLERAVLAEAIVPGLSDSPPLLADRRTSDLLWHFNFNRALGVNERLVQGREEIYFGHQFATKAATPTAIPEHAVQVYVDAVRDPEALRASFDYYRAIDAIIEQNQVRRKAKLALPLLTIAGAESVGDLMAAEFDAVAEDVTSVVLPGTGHYVPEENAAGMLAAMRPFLAEYLAAA